MYNADDATHNYTNLAWVGVVHAPISPIFNVSLYDEANTEDTIYRSKAVGEPPLMLGISAWCALRDACASIADYKLSPTMNAPATSEEVYRCIREIQNAQGAECALAQGEENAKT